MPRPQTRQCSRRYYGEEHSGEWDYYTIDARFRGMPASSGISIRNNPTHVCGHNGDRSARGFYCGEPADHEWREVWACGSGGGNDGGNDGGSNDDNRRVKLSMEGDSEWVMEDDGLTPVTVRAELSGEPRNTETRVNVELDPHEASPDDFDASADNFEILIPAQRMSGTHTFTFTPVDDEKVEADENLMFTGDTGQLDIPVDPTTLMIKDHDGGRALRFAEARYTFDLPEHHDGRREPFRLGVVAAGDPEDGALRYTLAAGDASRFALHSAGRSIS